MEIKMEMKVIMMTMTLSLVLPGGLATSQCVPRTGEAYSKPPVCITYDSSLTDIVFELVRQDRQYYQNEDLYQTHIVFIRDDLKRWLNCLKECTDCTITLEHYEDKYIPQISNSSCNSVTNGNEYYHRCWFPVYLKANSKMTCSRHIYGDQKPDTSLQLSGFKTNFGVSWDSQFPLQIYFKPSVMHVGCADNEDNLCRHELITATTSTTNAAPIVVRPTTITSSTTDAKPSATTVATTTTFSRASTTTTKTGVQTRQPVTDVDSEDSDSEDNSTSTVVGSVVPVVVVIVIVIVIVAVIAFILRRRKAKQTTRDQVSVTEPMVNGSINDNHNDHEANAYTYVDVPENDGPPTTYGQERANTITSSNHNSNIGPQVTSPNISTNVGNLEENDTYTRLGEERRNFTNVYNTSDEYSRIGEKNTALTNPYNVCDYDSDRTTTNQESEPNAYSTAQPVPEESANAMNNAIYSKIGPKVARKPSVPKTTNGQTNQHQNI